jgi:hypothetical protein
MSHTPRNVNELHRAEQAISSFNQQLAVALTRLVGSMSTAYLFAILALIGLCGILGLLNPVVVILVSWFSQTFLQLVFLPILSVGQQVLGRHQELQAEEQYQTTQKTYQDAEQMNAALQRIEHQVDALLVLVGQMRKEEGR